MPKTKRCQIYMYLLIMSASRQLLHLPTLVWTNQGTNFVAKKNELASTLSELDPFPLREYLSSQDCYWIEFNLSSTFSMLLTWQVFGKTKHFVPS